jgi:uncharacterized protein YjbJ (UPF0337 family)
MINTTPPAITPVKGNWSEQKTKLKAKYTTLTDADLNFEDGKRDAMMNNLQIKLGKTKQELIDLIESL